MLQSYIKLYGTVHKTQIGFTDDQKSGYTSESKSLLICDYHFFITNSIARLKYIVFQVLFNIFYVRGRLRRMIYEVPSLKHFKVSYVYE